MILYVQEQGAIIQKRNESIEVRIRGALLYKIPFVGLERLAVVGYVQITTQALYALAYHGVDVLFINRGGKLSFALQTPKSDHVFLRLAQYRCSQDKEYCLHFAKVIVQAKLASQIEIIRLHKWEGDFDWKSVLMSLEEAMNSVPGRADLDALRGAEGIGTRSYFECFGEMSSKLTFNGRSRRPAQDEANALLNLGYSFLCNECIRPRSKRIGCQPWPDAWRRLRP